MVGPTTIVDTYDNENTFRSHANDDLRDSFDLDRRQSARRTCHNIRQTLHRNIANNTVSRHALYTVGPQVVDHIPNT